MIRATIVIGGSAYYLRSDSESQKWVEQIPPALIKQIINETADDIAVIQYLETFQPILVTNVQAKDVAIADRMSGLAMLGLSDQEVETEIVSARVRLASLSESERAKVLAKKVG